MGGIGARDVAGHEPVQLGDQPTLDRRRREPIDLCRGFEPVHGLAEASIGNGAGDEAGGQHQRRIGVKRIDEEPRRGRIGADMTRGRCEERVHRADRDRVSAVPGCRFADRRHPAEAADPAIARCPQRVDLHRRCPATTTQLVPDRRAAVGRDGDGDGRAGPVGDAVVAHGKARKDHPAPRRFRHHVVDAPLLVTDLHGTGRDPRHRDGLSCQRRDQRPMHHTLRASITHGGEQRPQRLGRHGAVLAALVPPGERDPGPRGPLAKILVRHGASSGASSSSPSGGRVSTSDCASPWLAMASLATLPPFPTSEPP